MEQKQFVRTIKKLIQFIMNKHNQKPTDMFNKQDVTVYLTYIKILKDLNILNLRLHIPEAIFKVKTICFLHVNQQKCVGMASINM